MRNGSSRTHALLVGMTVSLLIVIVTRNVFMPLSALAQASLKSSAWAATNCDTSKLKDLPADRGVECRYISAPLRYAQLDEPKIQLASVVMPSKAPNRQPDPLIFGQGGPGGSTIDTFASIISSSPEYNPSVPLNDNLFTEPASWMLSQYPTRTATQLRQFSQLFSHSIFI